MIPPDRGIPGYPVKDLEGVFGRQDGTGRGRTITYTVLSEKRCTGFLFHGIARDGIEIPREYTSRDFAGPKKRGTPGGRGWQIPGMYGTGSYGREQARYSTRLVVKVIPR